MSILDRKPKRYSTSDLFWEPHSAPTDGAVGDINTMRLDPSHLGMAQDVIVDTNGVLRNRGAFSSFTADSFTGFRPVGMAQISTNPLYNGGALLALFETGTNRNFFYGTSVSALTGFAKLTVTGTAASGVNAFIDATAFVVPSFAKLPNDGGVFGAFQDYRAYNNWGQPFLWGGNAVTTSDTSAGTAASTVGSKAIAGVGTAWTTALQGCYLFITSGASARYVGQVDQVTSTTAITLKKCAIQTVAAGIPFFKTARLPMYMVYKGRITTSTTSAIVVGANTKFNSSGPGGSASLWMTFSAGASVYRYFDGGYIGQVTSVQNDTTLTLTGNAALALTNEEYFIIPNNIVGMYLMNSAPSSAFTGTCVEQYSDRYWVGCIGANDPAIKSTGLYHNSVVTAPFIASNSIMFSKKNDPECWDLDPVAGDILKIPAGTSPDMIRGLCSTRGGMVVFRGFDTFLLVGYSPETFRIIKLIDDGVFCTASYAPYKDGVVWAGRNSIWYFNGTTVIDLLSNKVKRFYQRSNDSALASSAAPPGLTVSNDSILFSYVLPAGFTDRTWPYKNTTKTIQDVTLVINMLNGAVSFFTNIHVTGGMVDSSSTPIIITTTGLLDGNKVFQDSSTAADNFDSVTGASTFTSGAQIGPDVQFETTKLSLGNAARMKFWKMLLMNYSSDVSMTASIIGINTTLMDFPNTSTGTAALVTFPVSSNIGILKRIKFLVRTPQLVVRFYQTATTSSTSQRFKMYWYTIGGKWMRQGRQQ